MMGTQVAPAQLFYEFCLDDHVPADHLLRRIDRFLDLERVRSELKPFYSTIGRPSIDPELMMRMLIVISPLPMWLNSWAITPCSSSRVR